MRTRNQEPGIKNSYSIRPFALAVTLLLCASRSDAGCISAANCGTAACPTGCGPTCCTDNCVAGAGCTVAPSITKAQCSTGSGDCTNCTRISGGGGGFLPVTLTGAATITPPFACGSVPILVCDQWEACDGASILCSRCQAATASSGSPFATGDLACQTTTPEDYQYQVFVVVVDGDDCHDCGSGCNAVSAQCNLCEGNNTGKAGSCCITVN